MSQSNYSPNPYTPVSSDYHGNMGNLRGTENPDGVVFGRRGWSYWKYDTEELFFNSGEGRNTDWEEFTGTGGPGSDPQVFASASSNPAGDPGVDSAIHYRLDTGNVWVWNDTAGQWDQIL